MGTVYAVAGGKGGIGKSVVSIMFGRACSLSGKRTILVDADLGGANLHTLLGMIYPQLSIVDFLMKRTCSLEDVQLMTRDKNIRMISGTGEVLGSTNLQSTVKSKLIRHIKGLDADCIILDLGAGSSFNVLDFFIAADRHLLVVSTEPPSLQNVYEFLKLCIGRILHRMFYKEELIKKYIHRFVFPDQNNGISTISELLELTAEKSKKISQEINTAIETFHPYLIVNMAEDRAEAKRYFTAVESTAWKYLNTRVTFLATLFKAKEIQNTIKRGQSLLTMKLGVNYSPVMKISALLNEKASNLTVDFK